MAYKTCPQCNEEFKTYRLAAIYCGKRCADKAMINRTELICHQCGKSFLRENRRAKNKEHVFCTPGCHQEWMYGLSPEKTCPICETIFRPPTNHQEQIFCSQRCWYDYKTQSSDVPCDHCGKVKQVRKAKLTNQDKHYCSRACWRKSIQMEGNPAWNGGYAKYKGPNWEHQSLKCRKRDSFTCQSCYKVESTRPFHAHHRTPYRLFGKDWVRANDLRNLITLCDSCHSRIEQAIRINRIDTIPQNCRPLKSHLYLMPPQSWQRLY